MGPGYPALSWPLDTRQRHELLTPSIIAGPGCINADVYQVNISIYKLPMYTERGHNVYEHVPRSFLDK